MSKIMERIIDDSIPIWNECIETEFIKEFTAGTLKEEKLLKYLIEDTIYLREYARCFAYAMTKANTLEEIRVFYTVLSFVNENETSIRKKYLKKYNLTDNEVEKMSPSNDNQIYINHMLNYAKNGNIKEILMALLPCMLSYNYVFTEVNKLNPYMLKTKYNDLLCDYISNDYQKCCSFWIEFTNQLCETVPKEEEVILTNIFRESSKCELAFWNMSYGKKETIK